MNQIDLNRFRANAPAGRSAIDECEGKAGVALPPDYKRFVERMNGGQGFVGKSYIILWRIEELLAMNQAYRVSEFAPGLFLFGSDGGGEAYAFDMRSNESAIISVPFVGMDLSSIRLRGGTFEEFLNDLLKT